MTSDVYQNRIQIGFVVKITLDNEQFEFSNTIAIEMKT